MTHLTVAFLELLASPENPCVILIIGAGSIVAWRYLRARRSR